jgi:hypothetical protein
VEEAILWSFLAFTVVEPHTNRYDRKINRPREEARREREAEARSGGLRSSGYTDDDDDEMQL